MLSSFRGYIFFLFVSCASSSAKASRIKVPLEFYLQIHQPELEVLVFRNCFFILFKAFLPVLGGI